jgi:hypothetical protein
MRYVTGLLLALSALACRAEESMSCTRACLTTSPPAPTVNATARVVPVAGGAPNLEVSAAVQNATTTHLIVAQCPLVIRFYPDPPASVGLGGSDACPTGSLTRDLAPGDTNTMTRVLRADTLASFAPGRYLVEVAVTYHEVARTTGDAIMGVLAGGVQFPLDTSTH